MGVHIDTSQVKHLSYDLSEAGVEVDPRVRAVIRRTAQAIRRAARANIDSHTGDLARSITISYRGRGMQADIGPRLFYGKYVEYGTPPHMIRAEPGGALAFGGGLYQAVHHPGASPKPFMGPAFDAYAPGMADEIADVGALDL